MAQYRRIWLAVALVCGFGASAACADNEAIPAADDPAWTQCADGARQVEAEFGIPAYLLKAVALTESGRSGPARQIASWPWTVNVNDGTPGRRFLTKEEAVQFVREKRVEGARSLDVGCMQVNLRHHPRAFTSVAAGFDPVVNIRYAATFLRQLKDSASSWEEAIARYHSFNPDVDDYAPRVLMFWQRERQQASLAPAKSMTAPMLASNDRARVILASAGDTRLPAVGTPSSSGSVLAWPK